jgi:RecQ family ATP-dependent DNA helicase
LIETGRALGDREGRNEMETIEQILARHFPEVRRLHAYQQDLISNLAAGKNCLGIIPNGGHRALVFQVQAMREPGLTVVISPLQSFADEQVRQLNARQLPAATLNGGKSFSEQRALLRDLPRSNFKLLYLTPDWLETTLLPKALQACGARISMVVIDQAHAVGRWINQWGGAFRTDYGRIPDLLDRLRAGGGAPNVLALTATLDRNARREIVRQFQISWSYAPPSVIRPQLKLHFHEVASEEEKPALLRQWLDSTPWTKALVYAFSRKRCEALARQFQHLGYKADYFHSLRSEAKKREVYQRYQAGDITLLFATSAYGTGIGVTDIDAVANYQIAHSVQDYYQMVGRGWLKADATRECQCVLFWWHQAFDMRLGWLKADEAAVADIGGQIDRLFGEPRAGVTAGALKSVRRDALHYARIGGILRNLYPLMIEEGLIHHLGLLPGDPAAIEMREHTQLWSDVLHLLNTAKTSISNPYGAIECDLGIRFEDICNHVYDQELAGNIEKFPASDHVVFRVLAPDPDQATLARLTASLQSYIELQKAEHEALRSMVTSPDHEAFLRTVLD